MEAIITETYKYEPKSVIKFKPKVTNKASNAYFVHYLSSSYANPGLTLLQRFQGTFTSLFLPKGYPNTVSADYLTYQIWDSLQAFSSSICGALATRSVMTGLGVGDTQATALGATLSWVFKSGAGMIGGIAFAFYIGDRLDVDLKQWRLAADLMNDAALALELASPTLADTYTTTPASRALFLLLIFCLASIAKACVGVAGGATRAALINHQSRANNSADVAAKDGSQETLVNLIALITVMLLLPTIANSGPLCISITFSILVAFHLLANYQAVKSIRVNRVNHGRYHLLVEAYLSSHSSSLSNSLVCDGDSHLADTMSVHSVNRCESLIPFSNWFGASPVPDVKMGIRFSEALKHAPQDTSHWLAELSSQSYFLIPVVKTCGLKSRLRSLLTSEPFVPPSFTFEVALNRVAKPFDELRALFQIECFIHLADDPFKSTELNATFLPNTCNGFGDQLDKNRFEQIGKDDDLKRRLTADQKDRILPYDNCNSDVSVCQLLSQSEAMCKKYFQDFYDLCTQKCFWDFSSTMFIKDDWRFDCK